MFYFLLYLFLEVIISVNISSAIGGVTTFVEIILSAFIGFLILLNFRETFMQNIRAFSSNRIDLEQLERLNLFTVVGAILLIIPGFLTDIMGLLMQFSIITSMIVNRYNVKSASSNHSREEQNSIKKDSDVIDVEIISDNTTTK